MTHEAKWRVIARDLRAEIDQGVLVPGDQVPTEADLAQSYGVARMTARNALVALERDGILAPGHPRTVARHHRLVVHITRTEDRLHPGESPTGGADSWVADMLAAGLEPAQRIEVITTEAGDDVASRLEIPPGTTVTARRLVREAGGEPHSMITFWFPREVADGTLLAEPARITEGSLAWLEKTYGPLSHEAEWTSRMPDLDEVIALDITAPGVPVTALWRRSLASSGQPAVTSLAIYPGDRTILRLSL